MKPSYLSIFYLLFLAEAQAAPIWADLLVVGGTESGCAAAVQAARMGVGKIMLVNDITWLGGQFSAEGLGAIDENRAKGYDGKVPIPRSGIFREVIDAIEENNAQLYGGIRRPGNTRVITTSRPIESEKVFRALLEPYENSGQITRLSNYRPKAVRLDEEKVSGVVFQSIDSGCLQEVRARMTIDATDWGDIIQLSGAAWDAGIDAQFEFGEPSAPLSQEPHTDMNPITWCMILEESREDSLYPKPDGYDPRYFNKLWGWINEDFAYTSRRLVDGHGFDATDHPDILLINTPPVDYPLDVYPADVAAALEKLEPGASRKSIVAMTPELREIVFDDARNHTLKYYHHLQQRFTKFHKMKLSGEFGTTHKLPPKPYIRESLRLVAKHIVKEQEVLGFGSRSNYAATMFPDAVFSWQFEMDFHPTKREWTTEKGDEGPWEAVFRGNRRFHRGGTGRSVFPLRALIPEKVRGLLGAQKNLGYTSIVSSSCRLHDHSIHAGQAAGAVAAVSLRHTEDPSGFYQNSRRMAEVWDGLLGQGKDGVAPLAIWPFADVDPFEKGFVPIQQLALRKLLGLRQSDTQFMPSDPVTPEWQRRVQDAVSGAGYRIPEGLPTGSRRDFAMSLWDGIRTQPAAPFPSVAKGDADGDGLPDSADPLPFTPGKVSWETDPATDGIPPLSHPFPPGTLAFNFTPLHSKEVPGFQKDSGKQLTKGGQFGWKHNLSNNIRDRGIDEGAPRDSFVFTRRQDTWECQVQEGRWRVIACLGDISHEQPGQHLTVEGKPAAPGIDTATGVFHETDSQVEVSDGWLTVTLGKPEGGANTCINWLLLIPVTQN
jgi:hypothetical protein